MQQQVYPHTAINPSRHDLEQREIISLFCGVSKDFMKALKAFKKTFEAP